jgi:aminotransferase
MLSTLAVRMQAAAKDHTLDIFRRCHAMGGINLAVGVADDAVPPALRASVQEAIDGGANGYTWPRGLPALREAIARKLGADNGLVVDPDREVVVTAGSTAAFYCACLALFDPGDEMVVFQPYYSYHVQTLGALGIVARTATLLPPRWTYAIDAVRDALSPRTKAILVNTPANPSGKVFGDAELRELAALAIERDLAVVTDEIYEPFVYDGRLHGSIAALPGMAERTVTISGFSKAFSITGWRVGYAAGPARWMRVMADANEMIYVCAPTPLQRALASALGALPPTYVQDLRDRYELKRRRLCEALRRAGLTPFVPEGGIFMLADVGRLPGERAHDKVLHLLSHTGVAAAPGDGFFADATGGDIARFCFAKRDDELDEACARLMKIA